MTKSESVPKRYVSKDFRALAVLALFDVVRKIIDQLRGEEGGHECQGKLDEMHKNLHFNTVETGGKVPFVPEENYFICG